MFICLNSCICNGGDFPHKFYLFLQIFKYMLDLYAEFAHSLK